MKYRKKPVVIEAILFDGDNAPYCSAWCEGIVDYGRRPGIVIRTEEGDMFASPGDWIIRGVKGEFYPCKPDIFEMTYEAVEE